MKDKKPKSDKLRKIPEGLQAIIIEEKTHRVIGIQDPNSTKIVFFEPPKNAYKAIFNRQLGTKQNPIGSVCDCDCTCGDCVCDNVCDCICFCDCDCDCPEYNLDQVLDPR